ncbi:MAG: GNAT family N-acetyltransferase [Woeseiaceae bacterium]
MTTEISIRAGEAGDLERLVDIYNYYVVNTHVTFHTDAFTARQRQGWLDQFTETGPHRLLVAEVDGNVIGYASSTAFKSRAAYQTSVETSVYLDSTFIGQRIGRILYSALLDALIDEPSVHRAYGGVALPNDASVELHVALGFEQVATFHEVGLKFDRYWDVSWFEKDLERSAMSELHRSTEELERGVEHILASPSDDGELKLIVRRPKVDERETPDTAHLDTEQGLVGDNWLARGSRHMPDGIADPEMQLNIMNTRVIDVVAQSEDRWALAGDQLFVDLDLGPENLPPGTKLSLGEAVIEVTEPPHTGCKKFAARFGSDAVVFVNSGRGKTLNFRGICAKVVKSGDVSVGDVARKI